MEPRELPSDDEESSDSETEDVLEETALTEERHSELPEKASIVLNPHSFVRIPVNRNSPNRKKHSYKAFREKLHAGRNNSPTENVLNEEKTDSEKIAEYAPKTHPMMYPQHLPPPALHGLPFPNISIPPPPIGSIPYFLHPLSIGHLPRPLFYGNPAMPPPPILGLNFSRLLLPPADIGHINTCNVPRPNIPEQNSNIGPSIIPQIASSPNKDLAQMKLATDNIDKEISRICAEYTIKAALGISSNHSQAPIHRF